MSRMSAFLDEQFWEPTRKMEANDIHDIYCSHYIMSALPTLGICISFASNLSWLLSSLANCRSWVKSPNHQYPTKVQHEASHRSDKKPVLAKLQQNCWFAKGRCLLNHHGINVVLRLIKTPRIMFFFSLHWLIKAPRIMSFFLEG